MTRIKKEYENVIGAIERGKAEAGYLNDKIQSMAQEPSTVRNYRRRHDELSKRCVISNSDIHNHACQGDSKPLLIDI